MTLSPLDGARSAYVFSDGARTLVHRLKYDSLHALAQPMGDLLAAYLKENPLPVDVLAPVPLHRWRQRRRGFNQAELLGRVVAQHNGIAMESKLLRRHHNTPQQVHTESRHQREQNVRGAFRCDRDVEGRRVLLVDDVLTTGATLRECAVTLRRAGAASVWALTFACTS